MSELDHAIASLFTTPFAPAPTVAQLERRRAQLRRRRANTRIAAVVCGLVAAFALTRVATNHRNEVRTVDGNNHRVQTVPTTHPLPAGSTDATPGDRVAPAATTPDGQPMPAVEPTTTTTIPPGGVGCTVEGNDNPVDVSTPIGGAGLGGYEKRCDYTATQAGGYTAHGNYWDVSLYRGDQWIEYGSMYGSDACGAVGTIQPGDRVTLIIRYGSEAVADPAYVRAGPDYHC